MKRSIFRAYDIRGVCGKDFDAKDFYTIAQAYALTFRPQTVALGHDVRATSPELWQQVAAGLTDAGVDVLNLGPCSTDMMYFGVANYRTDGGIIISASHNPAKFNGMKMVRAQAIPISYESGIKQVGDLALSMSKQGKRIQIARGMVRSAAVLEDYVLHVHSFINLQKLRSLRLVLNANSGYAGLVARRLIQGTPVEFQEMFFTPDGTFSALPEQRPDPMIPANRETTTAAIRASRAHAGVAWDADADRCFFFDENGDFIEGAYITALLARILIERYGPAPVLYDPRIRWPIEAWVTAAGGEPMVHRCGHSFIKERMRQEDALFAGEASAHYYFRHNFYADNGMIPFALMMEHLSTAGETLSGMVAELRQQFPVSGEINFEFRRQQDVGRALQDIANRLRRRRRMKEETEVDGPSFCRVTTNGDPLCRCNIRMSNTEPKLRLNVEARGDECALREFTDSLVDLVCKYDVRRRPKTRWDSEQ